MNDMNNSINTNQQTYKQSKKHKNTYVIKYLVHDYPTFVGCSTAPLPVWKKNGERVDQNGNCKLKFFVNPAATKFVKQYQELRDIYGEEKACTIVEYYGKGTDTPVVQIFAGTPVSLISGKRWYTVVQEQLNHASRTDFYRILGKYNRR